MIRMNANELPWQPCEIKNIALSQLKLNQYPNPAYNDLKKVLAYEVGCTPQQLTLGNGSDELIWLILAVLLKAEDTLVTHAPTFGEYERMAKLCGVKTVYAPLEVDWTINLDSLLTIARRQGAKLAIICRPNNPTGEMIGETELTYFLNQYKGYVLIDEAYIEFSNESGALALLEDYPNLLLLRTFSKAYGLAGLRLGYCIASAAISNALNTNRPPYNVNTLTETIAINALSQQKKLSEYWQRIRLNREELCQRLDALKIDYMPSSANFVLIKGLRNRFDKTASELALILKNAGYAVRSFEEPWLSDCLRLTLGTEIQNKGLLEVLCQL